MPNYVKIPREIIYDKDLTEKRVIIFSYLCARRSLDDTVAFSTTELCHWSRMKPNYRDGKINQKYYDVLLLLSRHGYFIDYPDFERLRNERKNSIEYHNLKLNTNKFDVNNSYGMIYLDELHKILNFKEEVIDSSIDLQRISSSYILLLLSYLRVNMNWKPDKPQCCYRLYKTISEDIGISERYIARIADILSDLGIIAYKEMKRSEYINGNGVKKYKTNPKIFTNTKHYIKDSSDNFTLDMTYDYKSEIQKQILLLEQMEK